MRLSTFERRLRAHLLRAERTYVEAVVLSRHDQRHVRRHRMEGAVSDAWQAYCDFVRSVCMHSAIGSVTSQGTVTLPSIVPATWERASHIAARVSRNKPPTIGGVNNNKRIEPTWGDVAKVIRVVSALSPTNAHTLVSNFGGSLYGPPHCQKVRNACAHKNDQNIQAVRELAVFYVARPITIPTEALTWIDTISGKPAFISWLDDMRDIAAGAVA